ncbi:fimbrial protein [Cronobacter universalis]|uniref:fimbrial protein n=1 Tax=Cronobacter universalis TaxID=535744 RepID=UPI003CED88A6
MMKKSILGLVLSTIFVAGAVQADTNPNDVSATLSVTGTVMEDVVDACTVTTDKASVALIGDADKMIEQGKDASVATPVRLNITGANCLDKVIAGKIAYKFVGTADNAGGTVLANSDNSAEAAKGVGVGVFASTGKPLKINSSDHLEAATGGNVIGLTMVRLTGQSVEAGNVTSALTIEIERL